MVPAPAGGRFAPGRPRAHRGVEPRGLAHTLAPFRDRALAGRECPGPCHRERQGHVRSGSRSRRLAGIERGSRPQMLAYERLVGTSRVVRDLTANLRQDRGIATSNLVAICGLERELAEDFERRGKYSESHTLFMDAMKLLEGRRSGALDPDIEQAYARSLRDLGWAARFEQRYDEALVWLRRAEGALEALAHTDRKTCQVIAFNSRPRRENGVIAGLFGRRGQDESRQRLLESHIGMLERLSERAGSDPAIGLLAALARVILAPDESATRRSARDGELSGEIDGSRNGWQKNWRCGLPASSRIRSDAKSTGKRP